VFAANSNIIELREVNGTVLSKLTKNKRRVEPSKASGIFPEHNPLPVNPV
jgi:hypothetical protein